MNGNPVAARRAGAPAGPQAGDTNPGFRPGYGLETTMKKSAILAAAFLFSTASVAFAQMPGVVVPSAKSVADGAKQGATDAANAEVEEAKAAATEKATGAAAAAAAPATGAAVGNPGATGAATGAAAGAVAPATEKAAQAKSAADSAKQTGDAVKSLGTIGQ